MFGWSTVVKKRETSLLIGYSLGTDMSCSGRLRYRFDSSVLEFLRLPKGEADSPEIRKFIRALEQSLKDGEIPWQKTCVRYRSIEAEEGFDRMMQQVYA
ncbi:MAG TPA: hypothetical protein DEP57_07375 [Selenomonas sp.]|nr:hypothetical protein [Selenomonas sp.]